MFKRILGTKDILPEEAVSFKEIEEISRNIFSLYNYQEIRTPLIEAESLFNRSLGETAEIIQKQMFLMKNKKEIYVLRPEATASVVRAYLENNLDKTKGFVKLYYSGPMFRLERPQKGRLRQFHHVGCEVIGSGDPGVDIEVISLAENLLQAFSIDGYKIEINSLGCPKDKKALTELLRKNLKTKTAKLCADCQRRFRVNVLRIMDCKNENCKELVRGLKIKDAHLCAQCRQHFSQVKAGLEDLKINYSVNPNLVRGLDYYTRTVFEIVHPNLGSQDALGAGGRYDNLVKELGGPDVGAMGFAFGIERLLLISKIKNQKSKINLTFLITLGEEAKKEGTLLLNNLRKDGILADTDYAGKSLKGALRRANDLGARFVLILGEDELKKKVVTLKDMVSGEQREIQSDNLIQELRC